MKRPAESELEEARSIQNTSRPYTDTTSAASSTAPSQPAQVVQEETNSVQSQYRSHHSLPLFSTSNLQITPGYSFRPPSIPSVPSQHFRYPELPLARPTGHVPNMTVATQTRIFDQTMFAESQPFPSDHFRQTYQHSPASPGNPWNWYGGSQQPIFGHFNANQSGFGGQHSDQHGPMSHWSPELHSQSTPNSGQVSPTSVSTPTVTLRPILPTAPDPARTTSNKPRGYRDKSSKPAHKKATRRGSNNVSAGNPGPIPASQPRVIEELPDGTRMIEFEYNQKKDRHIFRIKANVDSVDVDSLDEDFKIRNALYPKTAEGVTAMKKRYPYETNCNDTAWRLVALNPQLDAQRGLIQRAVDSWRNTHPDPMLHSRRVKRQRRSSNHEQPRRDSAALTPVCGPPASGLPSLPEHSNSMFSFSTAPPTTTAPPHGLSAMEDGWHSRNGLVHSPMSTMFAESHPYEQPGSASTSFSSQLLPSSTSVDGDGTVMAHAPADTSLVYPGEDSNKGNISRSASFNVMPRIVGHHLQFMSQPSSPINSRSQTFDLYSWDQAARHQHGWYQ